MPPIPSTAVRHSPGQIIRGQRLVRVLCSGKAPKRRGTTTRRIVNTSTPPAFKVLKKLELQLLLLLQLHRRFRVKSAHEIQEGAVWQQQRRQQKPPPPKRLGEWKLEKRRPEIRGRNRTLSQIPSPLKGSESQKTMGLN